MRDYLFRGKRKDNGEWVEGCGIIATENWVSIFTVIDDIDENSSEVNEIEVIPETVGQYTGLKDKNGTKIFEGDIVDVLYDVNYIGVAAERIGVFEVVFHNGCFMKQKGGVQYHFIPSDKCTVIGNIYDNPELLGGNNND